MRTSSGDKIEEVNGDAVKLKRGPQEGFTGARGGFYVIRNEEDWAHAWPADRVPQMPSFDPANQMIFFAVSDTRNVTKMKVERILETGSYLYVWVKETKLGDGCKNKAQERAFDAVTTARADKPVKFYVSDEAGESCGQPPASTLQCRVGKQDTWANKLEAQPGDSIECLMTAEARGPFALVDKVLEMTQLPPGSTSKLAFEKGPERARFEVDVYGNYTVVAEAADEGGRRTKAAATIDVKPPKSKDTLVQLVWTGFDRADMPDTFPRVNLRVAEEGPKGQRCSADIAIPGLCEVKTRGAYTYMRIPEGKRKLLLSVQYTDERAENGPGPCIHVWYDGQRTGETCDRAHRSADEIWRIGLLDTATGVVTPEPVASADAGAPSLSTSPDAGTKKPAPAKKKAEPF